MQHLNSEMKQQQLDWRRSQVLQYSSEGYSQMEMAHKLQVDLATVNRDIHFLKMQAQESLHKHIHEIIPLEYQKAMQGMKRNLKQTLEIARAQPTLKQSCKPEPFSMIATNTSWI